MQMCIRSSDIVGSDACRVWLRFSIIGTILLTKRPPISAVVNAEMNNAPFDGAPLFVQILVFIRFAIRMD